MSLFLSAVDSGSECQQLQAYRQKRKLYLANKVPFSFQMGCVEHNDRLETDFLQLN